METIIVVVIIAVAAAYTVRSLYRKVSVGKKTCACEDGCPISEMCNPKDNRCVLTEDKKTVAK
jgi:hypothetical protein